MHNVTPCTATTRNGNRCSNPPITGATVCRMHGGAAPQVKRKAAERIAEARDLALQRFVDLAGEGKLDPRVALDAVVRLTEQVETLEGRVARREGRVVDERSDLDRQIEQLLASSESPSLRPLDVREAD
jgi:hypothetical protein